MAADDLNNRRELHKSESTGNFTLSPGGELYQLRREIRTLCPLPESVGGDTFPGDCPVMTKPVLNSRNCEQVCNECLIFYSFFLSPAFHSTPVSLGLGIVWVCALKNDILVNFSSHTWKSLPPKFPKQPAQPRTRHRITPQLHILQLLWSLQHRDSPCSRTFGGPASDFPPPVGNRPKTVLLKIFTILDFSNKILSEKWDTNEIM